MDEHIQKLIEEAKKSGKPIVFRSTSTKVYNQGHLAHGTSAEGYDFDNMAIESNAEVDFGRFFYEHLSSVTGQDALLVHKYALVPQEPQTEPRRFRVDVNYSPLEKKAECGQQVFELDGEPRDESHEFLVRSLKTCKGTTYSVERAQKQE